MPTMTRQSIRLSVAQGLGWKIFTDEPSLSLIIYSEGPEDGWCTRAQVPLATISSIMGHESVVQTIRYLGINLDDQADAFSLVAQNEES